ncbi:MAG TPA: FAD-dependent thymidylate synthase [Candidatus Deferrimicrobiaceae bacterium]
MNVVLLASTPKPEQLVALAARLCYSPTSIEDLKAEVARKDVRKFIQHVIAMGHTSVLEHASFSFGIEGISRAASHQLVRHRIASFSQQSQRYVATEFGYVTPKSIVESRPATDGSNLQELYERHMNASSELYAELLNAGVHPEDARFVLPNATETKIITTMNARELQHFFALRLCRRAQWEIREMAKKMLALVLKKAPFLFEDSGPGCMRGNCPEGKMTCGEASEVRRELRGLKERKA